MAKNRAYTVVTGYSIAYNKATIFLQDSPMLNLFYGLSVRFNTAQLPFNLKIEIKEMEVTAKDIAQLCDLYDSVHSHMLSMEMNATRYELSRISVFIQFNIMNALLETHSELTPAIYHFYLRTACREKNIRAVRKYLSEA